MFNSIQVLKVSFSVFLNPRLILGFLMIEVAVELILSGLSQLVVGSDVGFVLSLPFGMDSESFGGLGLGVMVVVEDRGEFLKFTEGDD